MYLKTNRLISYARSTYNVGPSIAMVKRPRRILFKGGQLYIGDSVQDLAYRLPPTIIVGDIGKVLYVLNH